MITKKELINTAKNQLIEKGNLEAIEKFFTVNYTAHAEGKDYMKHKFIKQFAKQLRNAIPDITIVNTKFFAEEGNIVTWQ